MIVDTHILISQIIYKNLLNQINFKLNRVSFALGNIKPDFIASDIKCPHTLYESLSSVNKYSQELMGKDMTIKKFSRSLGVICHFSCDYFCIYHREGNDKKGIFKHLLYEFMLHIKLISIILRGKLNVNNCEMSQNSVEDIEMMLQKNYNLQSESVTRDINYALCSAYQISKLIVCSSPLYYEKKITDIA